MRNCPADAAAAPASVDPLGESSALRRGEDLVFERLVLGEREILLSSPYLPRPFAVKATLSTAAPAAIDYPRSAEWGRIVADRPLPGALVSCYDAAGLVARFEGDSPLLAPGDYRLRIDLEGRQASVNLRVEAGLSSVLPLSLIAEKAALERRVAGRKTGIRVGWVGLGTGALGGLGAAACYFLGRSAMADYEAAATTAAAAEARQRAETFGLLMTASAGVGISGLGSGAAFVLIGPKPEEFSREAAAIAERIASFKEVRR